MRHPTPAATRLALPDAPVRCSTTTTDAFRRTHPTDGGSPEGVRCTTHLALTGDGPMATEGSTPQTLLLWIRSGRAAKAMTQRELGMAVGVGTGHISKIEAGKELPSDALLERIAHVLDLDADELIIAAGRVPARYMEAMQRKPAESLEFLRSLI